MKLKRKVEKRSKIPRPMLYYGLLGIVLCFILLLGREFYLHQVQKKAEEPRVVLTTQWQETDGNTVPLPLVLKDGEFYVQKFYMVEKGITGLAVGIDNWEEHATGELEVFLRKEGETSWLKEWKLNLSDYPFSGFVYLGLEERIEASAGEVYELAFRANKEEGESIQLLTNYKTEYIYGVEEGGDASEDWVLQFKLYSGTNRILKYFYLLILLGILLGGFLLVLLNLGRMRFELKSGILICYLSCFFAVAVPPLYAPDEGSHFITAYTQGSQWLGEDILDEDGRISGEREAEIFLKTREPIGVNHYVEYIRGIGNRYNGLRDEKVTVLRSPLSMQHLGYFPQAFGVFLVRLFHGNGYQMFLLSRIFAGLVFSFLMYWAIRLTPVGKEIFAILGILPMTLQEVASFSYDSLLNGILFFQIAYLLYLAYKKNRVTWKDGLLLLGTTVVVVPIKFIYFILMGLGILIPSRKFGGLKNKILCGLGLSSFATLLIVFSRLHQIQNAIASTGGSISDGLRIYSLSDCLKAPLEVGGLFLRTLREFSSFYLESMLGQYLGRLDIDISGGIILLFSFLLFLSVLQMEEERRLLKQEKWILGALCAGGVFVIFVVFLLSETYIGSDYILGIQGRYFLPLLPLALLLFQNKIIVLKKEISTWILTGGVVLEWFTILKVVHYIITR